MASITIIDDGLQLASKQTAANKNSITVRGTTTIPCICPLYMLGLVRTSHHHHRIEGSLNHELSHRTTYCRLRLIALM